MAIEKRLDLRLYFRQQPVMFAWLSVLLIIFFIFVTGLSRTYYAQRQALGSRWFSRGVVDLKAKNYASAVMEFRTALLYSRDNYTYQMNLAEALLGLGHTGEASAYFLNLLDREPEDGLVNLEVARIAAQQGDTKQAVRHYHDAVYAAWSSDQEWQRRDARFELIQLLLRINAKADAQSELIALAENVGDDPAQQQRIGDLFLRAQDYEHALASYRVTLRSNEHNTAALSGAGQAAFNLHRYAEARRYLRAAVAENPQETQSADLLKTTELVLRLDPYRRPISGAERSRAAVEAFAIAGDRLKTCMIPTGPVPGGAPASINLSEQWAALKPKITEENLKRDPELIDSAADMEFRIERQASIFCGTPSGPDLALLLIAKLHEGS